MMIDTQSPEWEVSQLLKFLGDPRVSVLEVREREEDNQREARNEEEDEGPSEDSDTSQ